MNGWYLDAGSRGRAAVVNQSGRTAYGVHVSNFGHAAVRDRRNWSRTVQAVEDGEGIAFTYARARGPTKNLRASASAID